MSGDALNPAAEPFPVVDEEGDDRWMDMHLKFVKECRNAEPEVLLIGDEMIQLMAQFPVWDEFFAPMHALNFGIAGDTTCNVLWRLVSGELDYIKPKVVVLWVGTCNYDHTAEQVADGIMTIVHYISDRLGDARIVVMGLLPRGENPNPLRQKHHTINFIVRHRIGTDSHIQFLDMSAEFILSDGRISKHDLYDFLHLSAGAYRAIGKPLSDLICHLLEEAEKERQNKMNPV